MIDTLVVSPFATNTYLVWDEKDRKAIIIDPGDEVERIVNKIEQHALIPEKILLTHAHPDHIGALMGLASKYAIETYVHRKEKPILNAAPVLGMLLGLGNISIPSKLVYFHDQDSLIWNNNFIKVLETPGHTPGSVCYLVDDALFTGDTLFAGSVGRVDLPGGSWKDLKESLKMIASLPDTIAIYPGHGDMTKLAVEKATNPYLLEIIGQKWD